LAFDRLSALGCGRIRLAEQIWLSHSGLCFARLGAQPCRLGAGRHGPCVTAILFEGFAAAELIERSA
jgi:hypothetical protein